MLVVALSALAIAFKIDYLCYEHEDAGVCANLAADYANRTEKLNISDPIFWPFLETAGEFGCANGTNIGDKINEMANEVLYVLVANQSMAGGSDSLNFSRLSGPKDVVVAKTNGWLPNLAGGLGIFRSPKKSAVADDPNVKVVICSNQENTSTLRSLVVFGGFDVNVTGNVSVDTLFPVFELSSYEGFDNFDAQNLLLFLEEEDYAFNISHPRHNVSLICDDINITLFYVELSASSWNISTTTEFRMIEKSRLDGNLSLWGVGSDGDNLSVVLGHTPDSNATVDLEIKLGNNNNILRSLIAIPFTTLDAVEAEQGFLNLRFEGNWTGILNNPEFKLLATNESCFNVTDAPSNVVVVKSTFPAVTPFPPYVPPGPSPTASAHGPTASHGPTAPHGPTTSVEPTATETKSPSETSSTTAPTGTPKKGLSGGTIAIIVVAIVGGLLIAVLIVICVLRKKRAARRDFELINDNDPEFRRSR
jgi:hypothetical protein